MLEALRHGVPMLAIPLIVDHPGNVARLEMRRLGLILSKGALSVDSLTNAIEEMLSCAE